SFTRELARRSGDTRFDALPSSIRHLAAQCLLDWAALAVAGCAEPVVELLAGEVAPVSGGASVVGRRVRVAGRDAALLNAAAAHALDYDDVNPAMSGHPSVPVLAATLAEAELRNATLGEVLEAFVAGYEAECIIGRAVEPYQYERGFHASGTTGTFGAAVGVARLLRLDVAGTARAIGIAATSASGLKAVFGSMGKPYNVATAASNGLLAARLASRGMDVPTNVLEATGGFALTFSGSLDEDALSALPGGFHLAQNLFKYHAACYGTHSCIEGLRRLLEEERVDGDQVNRVVIHATQRQGTICAIAEPSTGLEAKFSLRHAAAMVLEGWDTSAVASFGDSVGDAAVVATRGKVEVLVDRDEISYLTPLEVTFADGRLLGASVDVSRPDVDLDRQGFRLAAKARSLAGPVVGGAAVEKLIAQLADVDPSVRISTLLSPLAAATIPA
ncbi:MAG: MmgE/PrpD family protein, partial [Acidimicrobiales bacterium]